MKKFLSLVLALIMTMSLVTISAGATEYKDLSDKDEIQYEEAVAVLNRIGVITGYDDGSFRPETELTRGAAAKIIVSLLIGPEAASNLPNATAPYPDVPASHTFAGVISYCKTAGIISGYGDGTFKPGNSLTGYAFAKMLLGALGYKSEIEGFVDTGWTMNVARVGNVAGLFDRLDFDGAASVNREQACQLALNTLKATEVTYGGTTMVTSATQSMFVQGTQAMYVTSNNRDINANINRRVISAQNNELTLEFGEEHFKDLRLEHDRYDPAFDNFGRPSNEWSYKKVTIGTFPLEADFTFTKQMAHLEDSAAAKEKALGLRGYDTYSTDHKVTSGYSTVNGVVLGSDPFEDATQITINGFNARVYNKDYKQGAIPAKTAEGEWFAYDARSIGSNNKEEAPTLSEIADLTDNGVTVEVYVCPVDADFITHVVVTRTQMMKVKRIASDYVSLERIDPDSDGAVLRTEITGYNDFAINEDIIDVKDSNYDCYNALKDLKAGDYVAVIPYTADDGRTWEAGEVYVPETVTGAFTKVDTYSNVNKPSGSAIAITVGGTSYPINQWNLDMIDVTGNEIKATKKDVTLYLAKDGTAFWADEIGNSDAWIIVGDYYQATGTSGKVGWYVHGWTVGGEEVDLDLGTIRGDAELYAPGELVRYTIADGGNGEYSLSKPNYSGTRTYKNGDTEGSFAAPVEPQLKDSDGNLTGEGIYEIAQWTYDNSEGKDTAYDIKSRNGALALENYGRTNNALLASQGTAHGDKWVDKTEANTPEFTTGTGGQEANHTYKYYNLPYDGVKFIFVNFDSVNGEVESIDFKSGVQNVDYEDIVRFNDIWRNIGTNTYKFVVTAAEAYVNKDGNVKAVVIKADSAEADLSKIAVITDTEGDRTNTVGAEGDRPSGLSYAKKYVTGPNFSKSDEQSGWFDKDYPVGTILTISKKGDLIVGKYFHSATYNNGNPDAVYVEGITPVKNSAGKNSKGGFLIGQDGNTVSTLNNGYTLSETGNNDKVVTGGDTNVWLLSNKYTSGLDTLNENMKGLVTVDKNTTFVDLRAGHNDSIEDLDDLLEYDLSRANLKLRLLVNGAQSTDTFRHAYVVIVEKAVPEADNAKTPEVTITAGVGGVGIAAVAADATGTGYDAIYNVEAAPKSVVNLAAVLKETDMSKFGTVSYDWANNYGIGGDERSISVEAPADKAVVNLVLTVTNKDASKADKVTATYKVLVKLTGKAEAVQEDVAAITFISADGSLFLSGDDDLAVTSAKIPVGETKAYAVVANAGKAFEEVLSSNPAVASVNAYLNRNGEQMISVTAEAKGEADVTVKYEDAGPAEENPDGTLAGVTLNDGAAIADIAAGTKVSALASIDLTGFVLKSSDEDQTWTVVSDPTTEDVTANTHYVDGLKKVTVPAAGSAVNATMAGASTTFKGTYAWELEITGDKYQTTADGAQTYYLAEDAVMSFSIKMTVAPTDWGTVTTEQIQVQLNGAGTTTTEFEYTGDGNSATFYKNTAEVDTPQVVTLKALGSHNRSTHSITLVGFVYDD